MSALRRVALAALLAVASPRVARGQPASAAAPKAPDAAEHAWSLALFTYAYLVPGDDDYVQPAYTADREHMHFEARYNYEARHAGSLWAGYNWSVGDTVTFEGTGMLGAVFGGTTGIAPGYRASLGWTKLTFYSEGEYLFDTDRSADSFFYAWSELTWAPAEWFRFGLAGQRTRVYQTDREIQRGFLVGFSTEYVDVTTYVFNPDERTPTVVLALGMKF